MAYLRVLVNPKDEESLKRIINYPARGIGQTTVDKLVVGAKQHNLSIFEVAERAQELQIGVNAGTGRAAKYLQKMIGATADGAIGPATLRSVNAYVQIEGLESAIDTYQKNRQEYYEKLKTFETFGRGWTRRNNETTEAALKMISS